MPYNSGDEGFQGKDPGQRTGFFPDRPPNASVKAYISAVAYSTFPPAHATLNHGFLTGNGYAFNLEAPHYVRYRYHFDIFGDTEGV